MTYQSPDKLIGLGLPNGFLPSLQPVRHRLITSNRFTLGMAILLGVFIPEIFHPWATAQFGNVPATTIFGAEAAEVGSVLAIVIGHLSHSRFTALPTIDSKTYIIPSFLLGYATVLAPLYASNILFGRYHFIVSFLIVVQWYFALAVFRARQIKTRVAIVGSGPHPIVRAAPKIEWLMLQSPVLVDQVSAIVVDTRSHLSPEWEHFIAQAVLMGIPVHDSRYMLEALTQRVEIKHMAENNFGSLLPALTYIRVKRVAGHVSGYPRTNCRRAVHPDFWHSYPSGERGACHIPAAAHGFQREAVHLLQAALDAGRT